VQHLSLPTVLPHGTTTESVLEAMGVNPERRNEQTPFVLLADGSYFDAESAVIDPVVSNKKEISKIFAKRPNSFGLGADRDFCSKSAP